MEQWVDINENYQVSNLGRVYSKQYLRMLKPSMSSNGYLVLSLGRGVQQTVHRLVCEAFHPNPDNLPQVNHKDKVRTNNFEFNLEWCTESENQLHSNAKYFKLVNDKGEVAEGYNVKVFCDQHNLDPTNLGRVLNGKRKTHKGWRVL